MAGPGPPCHGVLTAWPSQLTLAVVLSTTFLVVVQLLFAPPAAY